MSALFNVQPHTRGLNETYHWFNPTTEAFCPKCQGALTECEMYRFKGDQQFWENMFAHYAEEQYDTETHVLVDASKNVGSMFNQMPPVPDEYRHQVIILSKNPHEFAWSYQKHHENEEVGYCMLSWAEIYSTVVRFMDAASQWCREDIVMPKWVKNVPIIHSNDIAVVTYRDLASNPVETMRKLCAKLEVPFDEDRTADPWAETTDTCMVGGNNSIYAQHARADHFFNCTHDYSMYLGEKYKGKKGQVFLDEQWRRDIRFRQTCSAYYTRQKGGKFVEQINDVAKRIGYPDGCRGFNLDLTPKHKARRKPSVDAGDGEAPDPLPQAPS